MHSAQAAIAPQQNPFLYGDLASDAEEIDYTGTSNKTVFTYNGIGQRRVAAETVSGATTTTRYLWCGGFICQSRDGSDNALKRYLGEGEYSLSASQKLVYMSDNLGSVRDVLDATTGTRVASYDYSPYGAITQSSVTNGTDYQYAGLFAHAASGLNLATYRAVEAVTGRFINRDPIKETGGINLYDYVGADPINRIDPWGLNAVSPINPNSLLSRSQTPLAYSQNLLSQYDHLEINPAANPSIAGSSPTTVFPTSTNTSSTNSCSPGDKSNEPKPIVIAGSDPGPPCSGPNSDCTLGTRGPFPDPTNPGKFLCSDCYLKTFGPPRPGGDQTR